MDYSSILSDSEAAMGFGAIVGVLLFLVVILLITTVLEIIGRWKMNKKAGEPGWASIIPFYSMFTLIKISKINLMHFFGYMLVALIFHVSSDYISAIFGMANIAYAIFININLSKSFGKSTEFGVFATFFPFIAYLILGCGNSKYQK